MVVHMLLRITEVTEITVSYSVSFDCSCGQYCLSVVVRKSGQSVTSRTKNPRTGCAGCIDGEGLSLFRFKLSVGGKENLKGRDKNQRSASITAAFRIHRQAAFTRDIAVWVLWHFFSQISAIVQWWLFFIYKRS